MPRTLAPELQGHGREVPRRSRHHDPRDAGVPRVEDVVVALLEERGGLVDATRHDLDALGIQVAGDQASQELGGVGPSPRRAFSTAQLPAATAATTGLINSWIG